MTANNNRYILFVPGKNPKPPPDQHQDFLWRTLLEGVRRAEPAAAEELRDHAANFELIDWNHLYYGETRSIARDLPWIDALINQHGPSEQDIREAENWWLKFNRALYTIADRLPILIRFLPGSVRMTVEETQRYFRNDDNIARAIRGKLKQRLRPLLENGGKVLLIGHSLGSVIA